MYNNMQRNFYPIYPPGYQPLNGFFDGFGFIPCQGRTLDYTTGQYTPCFGHGEAGFPETIT